MNNPQPIIEQICSVEKWSSWSKSHSNLAILRDSMANSYALKDNCLINDVHTLINVRVQDNVGRLACTIEAAYLAEG